MKYVLHGDDAVASRNFMSTLVGETIPTMIEGKTVTLLEVQEQAVSNSLFGDEKIVIIENLLSKNPRKKEIAKFLDGLNSSDTIILWEDKKIPKTTTNMLKSFNVQDFLLPTYYFQFLDSLAPQYKKNVYTLYQKLLTTYAPEQLLFSLIKRIRLLVILNANGSNEELSKMPPWMLAKIQKQARLWPSSSLNSFYTKLQDAEIKMKTGNLPVELSKHLDIIILSHL